MTLVHGDSIIVYDFTSMHTLIFKEHEPVKRYWVISTNVPRILLTLFPTKAW